MSLTAGGRLRYLAAKMRHRWITIVPEVYQVHLRRTPVGAELDVSHLVEALVKQLAENYADDPAGVGDTLERIAELAEQSADAYGTDAHGWAGAERDHLIEQLVDDMGGARQRLYGPQAVRLGELIVEFCSRPARVVAVPAPREGGVAA